MNLNGLTLNKKHVITKNFKRKRKCFFLGDLNVDLLKYDNHAETNEFIDSLSSYMYSSA